jgi:hypothetical protein
VEGLVKAAELEEALGKVLEGELVEASGRAAVLEVVLVAEVGEALVEGLGKVVDLVAELEVDQVVVLVGDSAQVVVPGEG